MTWRPVDGYEGKYEVSDDGRVRKVCGKELGQWLSELGYCRVRLSAPRAMILVHRLVAKAFIPNPDDKPFVNHIDCCRSNNKAENLEWCTQAENLKHSELLGRMKRGFAQKGKRSFNAKLSDNQAAQIREEYAAGGISLEKLALKHGTSKRTAHRIVNFHTYKPLPPPPEDASP